MILEAVAVKAAREEERARKEQTKTNWKNDKTDLKAVTR